MAEKKVQFAWSDETLCRWMLRNSTENTYLFGDNWQQRGMGGQAEEMRGLPNCFGVQTKKAPSMKEDAFLTDRDFAIATARMETAIALAERRALAHNGMIIVPAGIGLGRAQLRDRAPRIYAWLLNRLDFPY